MGSSRLPGKMVLSINGETILETVLIRLLKEFPPENIYIAITDLPQDDILNNIADQFGIQVFRGDNENVLSRFVEIAHKVKTRFVCRLTGDSPMIMPELINDAYSQIESSNFDYVSTILNENFPLGVHVEVFKLGCLIDRLPKEPNVTQCEHVTSFIYNNSEFKCKNLMVENKYPYGRYTLDYLQDFHFFYKLSNYLNMPLSQITIDDLWKVKINNPKIFHINMSIKKERTAV